MRIYTKVHPRASRNRIKKISEWDYEVWLTAPPVDGKANDMLERLLADYFKVSKSQIKIIGGKTAGMKLVEVLI